MCECMCGYFSVGAVSMCFGVLCDFLRVFRNRVIYVVKTSILYDGQIGTTFFSNGFDLVAAILFYFTKRTILPIVLARV